MDCNETRTLIHGYVDGELDLVRSLEVERHMEGCSDCQQFRNNLKTVQTALRSGAYYRAAPPRLEGRIRSAVRREARGPITWRFPWQVFAGTAAAAAFALLVWFLPRPTPGTGDEALASEVVSGHVRSLMASHLADVISTDKHTVKPWFNGKLDFTPPVVDLKEQGFPLTGGRLDYLDGHPVAALIYQRKKHPINLFVWPSTGKAATQSDTSGVKQPAEVSRQGYHLLHWSQDGMQYWAVSDLNAAELGEFTNLLRGANQGTSGKAR